MTHQTSSVESLIPQRAPFVMIDELISYDEVTTQTRFKIKPENIFVTNGQFTEPGLVENIAQTAAARAGYIAGLQNEPVALGYIGAIKNLVVHALPNVNDELVTAISIENQIFDVMLIKGKVSCGTQLLAACEMKIFISKTK